MAEIVKRQMPAPRDIPQKIPAPRAKIRMQKPQSGGEFSVQIPGGARGGMVMAKIDNCITLANTKFLSDSSIAQLRFDMYRRNNVCLLLGRLLLNTYVYKVGFNENDG